MSALTDSQREAITAPGNVLVVAGAGTGKTRTLVERCLALLSKGRSLDQILMVTFTDAAVTEMRQRIRATLVLEAESGNAHFAEQLALVDAAPISTLHSFCLELVREHF